MELGTGFARLLLYALLGWTVLGAVGVTISFRRGERPQGRRNLAWIAAIWLIYVSILLSVSLRSKPRVVAAGEEYCVGSRCLSVVRSESLPGYLATQGERIVRIYIRIANHSGKRIPGDPDLGLYLVDSRGRRWEQAAGLEGVHLSTPVGPGQTVITAPVFKVSHDTGGLTLVLSHGRRLPYLLVIGDPDSILHAPVQLSVTR